MPEYTPTIEEVRSVWCAFSEYGGLADRPHSGLWDDRLAEFDRWLAARDRENRAIGWDEGTESATRFHEGKKGHWENDMPRKGLRTWIADPTPTNPYRGDNR